VRDITTPGKKGTAASIAVVAMLSLVTLLGVRLWASMELGALPLFLKLHASPDGRVFVPLDDSLYVESPAGESLEVIPLSRFGVRHFQGDFAVLSDDSILLKPGKLEGLEPLQRCSLKTGECRQLVGEGESFQAGESFRLTVDESQQRIWITDTEHHRLLLLEVDGRILHRKEKGFWFPSSMARVGDDAFLVSDTRHARIVRISAREDTFGKELGELRVDGWSKRPGHTRPKGIAIAADGARWVVLTDRSISNGELYRLGPEDATGTQLVLPEGTDAMYPEALADSVLLPDDALYRIHRFADDGTRMADFGSPELKARLSGFATRAGRLDAISRWSFIAMLFVAAPMLLIALWLNHRAAAAGAVELGVATAEPLAEGDELYRDAATRLRQERGEYLFQRRYTVLASREARRVGWVVGLLLSLTMLVTGTRFLVVVSRAFPFLKAQNQPLWPLVLPLVALAVVLLLAGIWWLQVQKHERLLVDARGVRYVSCLSGPLAFLDFLSPSWEMPWLEIERITLKPALGGRLGAAWYYELQERSGTKRCVNALSWRLAGEDEAGLTMQEVMRFHTANIQEAIRRTRLFRLLAGHERRNTHPTGAPAPVLSLPRRR
jgi:hypothetical protein